MTSTIWGLKDWLSGFALPVYDAQDVPYDARLPYITIPLKEPEYNQPTSFYINVWYRTGANDELTAKVDEIIRTVGVGVRIPCPGGLLALWPEPQLVQYQVQGDVRSAYISLSLNAYHCPGV